MFQFKDRPVTLIGLVGRTVMRSGRVSSMGSGKSTSAEMLASRFGMCEVALADPLKRICMETFKFTEEQLWGPSHLRNIPDGRYSGLTPRKALQLLGTEWGRACYPNIWIQQLLSMHQDLMTRGFAYDRTIGLHPRKQAKYSAVVVPDVRFPNEAEAIRAAGGIIVEVRRTVETHVNDVDLKTPAHSSETSQKDITADMLDIVVLNDGSLGELSRKMKQLVDYLSTTPAVDDTVRTELCNIELKGIIEALPPEGPIAQEKYNEQEIDLSDNIVVVGMGKPTRRGSATPTPVSQAMQDVPPFRR